MSGSGGSGGNSGDEENINCRNINFNTDVNSPQEGAVAGLKVKNKLAVVLKQNTVVVERSDTGQTVGSINWSNIAVLIECIREGNEYVAVIRSIQDGLVTVNISAK